MFAACGRSGGVPVEGIPLSSPSYRSSKNIPEASRLSPVCDVKVVVTPFFEGGG